MEGKEDGGAFRRSGCSRSQRRCFYVFYNVVCSSPNSVNLPLTHKEKHIYDRRSLLDIGNAYKHQLSQAATEKLRGLCLLLEPDLETAASPTDATPHKAASQAV